MHLKSFFISRLVLLVLLFFLFPASQADSQSLQWTSPSPQTIYGPGDIIKGEWSSSKSLVSPSVSLCAKSSEDDDSRNGDGDGDGDADVCGDAIWPSVEQTGDQFYFSLSAPSVASVTDYYLRLKDDFGNKMKSPVFALSPKTSDDNSDGAGGGGQTDETSRQSTQESDGAQEPSAAIETISDDDTSSSAIHASTRATDPSSAAPAKTAASSSLAISKPKATGASVISTQLPGPAATGAVSYIPSGPPDPSSDASGSPGSLNLTPAQYATSSRAAVPAAAIAIPLALVGTTLLISLILCIAHRRSLVAQRRRNSALMVSQQGPTGAAPSATQILPALTSMPSSATLPGDIEKAISALNGTGDVPSVDQHLVYVPVAVQQQRTQRQDVRREGFHIYGQNNVDSRSSSRTSSRATQHDYNCGKTPAQEYASSFPSYFYRQNSRGNESDDVSTTGSILTDYLSPYDNSRASHNNVRGEIPQALPRSHTRASAPCIDDVLFSREDVYDVVNHVLAKSSLLRYGTRPLGAGQPWESCPGTQGTLCPCLRARHEAPADRQRVLT